MQQFRIGSRESKLAVVQTEMVEEYIRQYADGIEPVKVLMKTTGDKILDRRLDQIGGKGLFVKELDLALVEQRSDLSVHSLKDVPMEVPEELPLIGYSRREDPRDVLVLPKGVKEQDLTRPIGCSSRRRTLQLSELFPGVEVKSIRGNVQTRLKKLDEGEYGALVLAAAGLKRLGLKHRISRYFSVEEMLPAAGQGILVLQGRAGEDYSFLKGFCDEKAMLAALAERAFVRTLDGGCSSPIAAYAQVEGDKILLEGLYCREDGRHPIRRKRSGTDPIRLGEQLAQEIKEAYQNEERENI